MSKRYIVTVTDTEGVVWLNTGSFSLTEKERIEFIRCIGQEVRWWREWEAKHGDKKILY